jgi:hypothetical protein
VHPEQQAEVVERHFYGAVWQRGDRLSERLHHQVLDMSLGNKVLLH